MLSTHKNTTTTGWFYDLFFITITLIIFYALWLGSYPLFTPDEGRYSEVAREMITSNNYITPRLNGIAFLDKPIFYYWLQVSAIKIFGIKEWALRFWPACLGILGCIVVYITGRKLYNRRTAIISTIMLATCPLYFGAAHYANLDLEVAVLISCTLLFTITAIHTSSKKYFILAYIFSALAMLTKGLIGIAFPVMILGTWILILNRWQLLRRMHLIAGLLLLVSIAAPWYILVQKENPQFFNYFFILQQFSRFLTQADFNNQTTSWFYAPIVLAGFFPWTCFLFQALYQQLKSIWQDKQQHSTELFIIIWFVIVFIFFSIPKSKTIGYILPVFPALSLVIGHYLGNSWGKFKNLGIRAGIFSYITIGLVLATVCFAEPRSQFFHLDLRLMPYLLVDGVIFATAAIACYVWYRFNKFNLLFACMTLASVLTLLGVVHSAGIVNQKSIKPLAQTIATHIKPDDEVVTYYRYYQDLPIYIQRRITIVANWHDNDIAKSDNWLRELWYHMNYVDSSSWLIENDELLKRWRNGNKRLFLLISKDLYPVFMFYLNLNLTTQNPVYLLGEMSYNEKDTIMLISNRITT